MNPDAVPRADPTAVARRRAARNSRILGWILRILVSATFLGLVYGAANLGVKMAKAQVATPAEEASAPSEAALLSIGSPGNPVYLAERPEGLRSFFSVYSSPGERASADLTDTAIRRINSRFDVEVLEKQADAIQVRVTSGPIAGTIHWIHHTQVPASPMLDPIITPLPGQE